MTQDRPDAADDEASAAPGRPTDEEGVAPSQDDDRPTDKPEAAAGSDGTDGDSGDDGNDGDGSGDQDDEPDFSSMPVDELPEPEVPDIPAYGEDDEQGYVDRDKIDFDPDEGLYSGTLVHGGDTELPDPPSDKQVEAALADIKSGGSGLVDEDGNKVKNRQDADD